jgi:hypothetical protein
MTKSEILESLGVQDTAAFDSGNLVWYKYQIRTADVYGYIQSHGACLTTSIFSINSQACPDGFRAYRKFYKASLELAKITNATQLEILGIAIINKDILRFVKKKERGFTVKEVPIPEKLAIPELGNNGTVECYSKIIHMR